MTAFSILFYFTALPIINLKCGYHTQCTPGYGQNLFFFNLLFLFFFSFSIWSQKYLFNLQFHRVLGKVLMLQHCASKSYLTKLFPYFFLLLTSQRRLQDCWCPPGLQRGGDPLCEGRLPLARRGGGGGAGRHRDVEQQHRRQRGNAAGAPQQCLWFTISGLLLVVALYQNTGNTACHLGNSAQLPSLSGFLPCAAGGGQEFEQQHMRSLALRWGQITQSRCNLLLCSLSSRWECLRSFRGQKSITRDENRLLKS